MNLFSILFDRLFKQLYWLSALLVIGLCFSPTIVKASRVVAEVTNPILESYAKKLGKALDDPTTNWRVIHGGLGEYTPLKDTRIYQKATRWEKTVLGTLRDPLLRKAEVRKFDSDLKKIRYQTVHDVLTKLEHADFRGKALEKVKKIDHVKDPQLWAYVQDLEVASKAEGLAFGGFHIFGKTKFGGVRPYNLKQHGGKFVRSAAGDIVLDEKGYPLGFHAFKLAGAGKRKSISPSPVDHKIFKRDLANISITREVDGRTVGGYQSYLVPYQVPEGVVPAQFVKDHVLATLVLEHADGILKKGIPSTLSEASKGTQLRYKFPLDGRTIYGGLDSEPCGSSCFRESSVSPVAAHLNQSAAVDFPEAFEHLKTQWDGLQLPGLQAGHSLELAEGIGLVSREEGFYKKNKLKILETDAVAHLYQLSLLSESLPSRFKSILTDHIGEKDSLIKITVDTQWTETANHFLDLNIGQLKKELSRVSKTVQLERTEKQTFDAMIGFLNHQLPFAQKRYRKAVGSSAKSKNRAFLNP